MSWPSDFYTFYFRLDCTDECRMIERNRRLAIGLQIRNPDLSSKLTPRYSEFMRQWAKKDPHFCNMVHEKLTELVQLAKQVLWCFICNWNLVFSISCLSHLPCGCREPYTEQCIKWSMCYLHGHSHLAGLWIGATASNTSHSNKASSTTVKRAWLTSKGSRSMAVLP